MITTGFAVKQNGAINVRTVSPTQLAAKINWLGVECDMPVYNRTPDREIEAMWDHFAPGRGARVVSIQIVEMVP